MVQYLEEEALYKPKQGDNVEGNPEGLIEKKRVDVSEMTGETVSALELNKDIPLKEVVELKKRIIHLSQLKKSIQMGYEALI